MWLGTGTNPEYESDKLRYGCHQPLNAQRHLWLTSRRGDGQAAQAAGGRRHFQTADYVSEARAAPRATGSTGARASCTARGTRIDGTSPLLLYGYGSYGISMDPTFSSARLSLLDRSFVYALAHIRGGEELRPGLVRQRQDGAQTNTFTDFIDCAEYLLKNKMPTRGACSAWAEAPEGGCSSVRLPTCGPTCGTTWWPRSLSWMVTTMLDDSIPLTTGEFDEWAIPGKGGLRAHAVIHHMTT